MFLEMQKKINLSEFNLISREPNGENDLTK